MHRFRLACVSSLLVAVAALSAPATSLASDPAGTLGVYVGPAAPLKVAAYERWRGRPVARVVDFLADDNWASIATPTWWVNGWSASAYRDRLVYSVPMLPRSTGTMQAGARGDYNSYFADLAKTLIGAGQGGVVIRLGWEMNGSWYRWSAVPDPQAYIGYFRQIVTAMRATPGAAFKFEWSANMGPSGMPADQAYPGDAYVDTIGLDVYDQYWGPNPSDPEVRWASYVNQPYGLAWHRGFAAAHGKRLTFPEWGVITRSDGYGGNDDPAFVQHMYDWIAANDVAWASYFEYDSPVSAVALMGGQFPRSASTFLQTFGGPVTAPAPVSSSPSPLPAADTTAPTTAISCNGAACSGSAYPGSVTVTLRATDAGGSGILQTRYTVDGSTPTPTHGAIYTGPITVTRSSTITFASWDAAANAEAPRSQRLKVH